MRHACFAWRSPGTPNPMAKSEENKDITGPEDPTHEATTPPGNGEADEKAVEEGKDKLEEAGGGH
jgi:hypothetical protein